MRALRTAIEITERVGIARAGASCDALNPAARG